MSEVRIATAAEALLARLKQNGVDYLFANAGTDFAPLVEALARAPASGIAMPEALAVPHETAAVAMAHGYTLVTGRPQAVMVHTNVGLANALMGVINAASDDVPMLLCSGRTPVTEQGRQGFRDTPIHWGQEMRDQAAMLREVVKWDYELRFPEQAAELADRALAIAASAPQGPVYMSLPREVLCALYPGGLPARPLQRPARPARPDDAAIDEAARILIRAERPLILAQRSGDRARGMAALVRLAEALGAPVVEHWCIRNSMPNGHDLHAGYDPHTLLAEADAVLVVDAMVPWIPAKAQPPAGCPVIQLGADPLFRKVPVRGFPADLALAGDVPETLEALAAALESRVPQAAARRAALAERNAKRRAAARERAFAGQGAPMSPDWVSLCLGETIGPEATVFAELGAVPALLPLERPGSFFGCTTAAGLGWALPAALGAQLADRDRLVVAAVGDGSYQFANPVACHQIAEALGLPVLTIVFNNGLWNAVRRATLQVHPDGEAARANIMPLTSLRPSPDFAKICEASRGWGIKVERGEDLPAALAQALKVVRRERRQALLNVSVGVAG